MNKFYLLFVFLLPTYYLGNAQSICFDPLQDNRFETLWQANGIDAIDYDNDGNMDVVVSNQGYALSLHRGLGNGFFEPAQVLADAGGAEMKWRDLNADGELDLLRYYAGDLVVNLNAGNYNMNAGVSFFTNVPNPSQSHFDVGDINGDGYLDAVANDYNNDRLVTYFGNGSGVFTIGSTIATLDKPASVTVADYNNDGLNEILVAYAEIGDLSVYTHIGGNSFSTSILANVIPVTGVAPLVAMVDYSGDNMLDLIISGAGDVLIKNQISPGVFGAAISIFTGTYAYAWDFGDWNGDGFMDMAMANETAGTVPAFLNNNGNGAVSGSLTTNSANGTSRKLAHADFDNDGMEDIVVACGFYQYFSFLKGRNNARFGSLALITGNNPKAMTAGDIDNDGDVDIINSQGSNTSSLSIQINNGNGSFANTYSIPTIAGTTGCLLEDLNVDGNLDLILHHDNGVAVLLGNGNATFDAPEEYQTVDFTAGGDRIVETGDFNGDGLKDLALVRLGTDSIGINYGTAPAQFNNYQSIYLDGYFKVIKSADLNGDGFDDLALTSNDFDELSLFFGSSSGLSQTVITLPAAGSPEGIAIFDANEDGDLDIVVACSNSNKINYYQGNGSTTFDAPVLFNSPTGSNVNRIDAGDMNGDGHLDVVASFYGMDGLGMYFGDGGGSFAEASFFRTDRRPTDVIVADFNNDGITDASTLNSESNNISVILNNQAFISYEGDLAFCEGGSVTLSVSTPGNYLWSNGETDNSIVASIAGDYYCSITNQSGSCTMVTPTVSVDVFNAIDVTFDLTTDLICDTADVITLSGGIPNGGLYSGPGVSGVFFDPAAVGDGTYEITYTYVDNGNCTNVTLTDQIVVELCIGIDENGEAPFSIYPNPTSGIISFVSTVTSLKIYNAIGAVVLEKNSWCNNLDISDLADGVYIVCATDSDGRNYQERIQKLNR